MKTAAIIQARMGSTRLPGKVLKPLAGQSMIDHVVARAGCIAGVDEVVVATSTSEKEQPLVNCLKDRGVAVFRGAEEDVLERYYRAASTYEADAVVRITADCPLLSPRVSGRVVLTFKEKAGAVDYVSNTLERTFPRGLDTEVFSFEVLEKTHREASASRDREHVTRYMRHHPDRFRLTGVASDEDNSRLRWTVDEESDLRLVRRIYHRLYEPDAIPFEYEDVLELLDREPALNSLNRHVEQEAV